MSLATHLLAPVERLVAALTDPARRERTAIAALAVYTAVWTLYGVFAKASQDIHFDMAEMFAWSRDVAFGYPKHPPFAGWLVAAWFALFPATDWAFYLLAMTVAAVALWIAWRLAADYLDAEHRVLALALLTLVPFFNFHALKFNANTILLPLWAATALCFLRSVETRAWTWAAAAGLCAAAAMLGKYWSVFLLAGLGIAALIDRRRAGYFRSAAPWVTIAVGALALAPHIVWLAHEDFSTFSYAVAGHVRTHMAAAVSVLGYLGGGIAYVALPVLLAFAAMKPGRAALADMAWPAVTPRRLVAAAFWGPLLLPAIVAPIADLEITSLWTMSAWTLLPVLLLSSPLAVAHRPAIVATVAFAVALPPAMTAVAPGIAYGIHRSGVTPPAAHSHLLADRVAHEWRQSTGQPLRLVAGEAALAYGVAFYLPDRPLTFPDFDRRTAPWVDVNRIAFTGMAVVCFAADPTCLVAAGARGFEGRRIELTLSRNYFGIDGPPTRYVILIVPPKA